MKLGLKTGNKKMQILVLVVLVIVIVIYAYYNYLIKPIVSRGDELQTNLNNEDTMLREMYSTAVSRNTRIDELKSAREQALSDMEPLFIGTNNEDGIDLISSLVSEAGLQLTSISSEKAYTFNGIEYDLENVVVNEYEMSLEVTGNYKQIHSFLESLDSCGKYTVCDSFNITEENIDADGTEGFLDGEEMNLNMNLEFIGVVSATSLSTQEYEKTDAIAQIVPQDFLDGSYRN